MKLFGGIFLVMALAGCATTGGLKQEPLMAGVSRSFSGPYPTVLQATKDAISDSGLHIDDVQQPDSVTWLIVAKKDASAWSWGELVRVVVQQTAPDKTDVRVVTERRLKTNVTAKGDYSSAILGDVALKIQSANR